MKLVCICYLIRIDIIISKMVLKVVRMDCGALYYLMPSSPNLHWHEPGAFGTRSRRHTDPHSTINCVTHLRDALIYVTQTAAKSVRQHNLLPECSVNWCKYSRDEIQKSTPAFNRALWTISFLIIFGVFFWCWRKIS